MKHYKHYVLFVTCILMMLGLQAQTEACAKLKPIKVVVIGSSTAAGTGPSTRDSAWVWRYRRHLESINPANEVINLAQGGYVTYRLMPDNHVGPAGRPAPDTAKNITKALSLNPDAIIVNLPSNDRQWPAAEQLANFDSLYRHSNASGVPIWICTTQPITSAAAYQMGVRDSILARYGVYALDFFSGIEDPSGSGLVDSTYAADAVHLNDIGHRILNQVVVDKDIPKAVFQAAPSPDLAVVSLEIPNSGECLDQFLSGQTIVVNLGKSIGPGWVHNLDIAGSPYQVTSQDSLRTCQVDTINWSHPITPGLIDIQTVAAFGADTFPENDSLAVMRMYQRSPSLSARDTAICGAGDVDLTVNVDADTVLWYDVPTGGMPVGGGNTFSLTNLQSSTVRYAQAVRGDLVNEEVLTAATTAEVDWNGVMFDLIADDDLIIDSLLMYISDLGRQEVTARYRRGSYLREAQNPAAWTLWGTDSVTFVNNSQPVYADFGALPISKGDTIGVYLHMTVSSNRLRYTRGTNGKTFQQSVLELYAGHGVSHTFGDLYFPRHWQGEVFFHYGNRLEGDCATPRVPVTVRVDTAGPDAEIVFFPFALDVDFYAGFSGYSSYLWDFGDGDTASGEQVSHTYPAVGLYTVTLIVENECGSDTMTRNVFVVLGQDIADELPRVRVYPNPSQSGLWRVDMGSIPLREYKLFDCFGKQYPCKATSEGSGIYRLEAEVGTGIYLLKLEGAKPVRLLNNRAY